MGSGERGIQRNAAIKQGQRVGEVRRLMCDDAQAEQRLRIARIVRKGIAKPRFGLVQISCLQEGDALMYERRAGGCICHGAHLKAKLPRLRRSPFHAGLQVFLAAKARWC